MEKIQKEEINIILDLTLEFIDLKSKTHVHKEFTNWTGKEIATIIEEIRYCLLSCGYTENTINKYIPLHN